MGTFTNNKLIPILYTSYGMTSVLNVTDDNIEKIKNNFFLIKNNILYWKSKLYGAELIKLP